MTHDLDAFVNRAGLSTPSTPRTWTALTGGVSSDIWRVDFPGGRSICVKRALPKLKVAADWHAPVSRNGFEWQWMKFAAGVLPHAVPEPLAQDAEAGVFAMAFLDAQSHPLWKSQLLAGKVDASTAAAVGTYLGRLHAASARCAALEQAFDTTGSFHALRLEPYLVATARRHAGLAEQLNALVEITAGTRLALVHGDVSPKNILAGPQGPVLLDAECAWYGDPAFDLAFCLNHLLLKAIPRPECLESLWESFRVLATHYFDEVSQVDALASLERRAAALLPALLLARVDGKSPVEYIRTDAQRRRVRDAAIPLVRSPLNELNQVAEFAYPRLVGA